MPRDPIPAMNSLATHPSVPDLLTDLHSAPHQAAGSAVNHGRKTQRLTLAGFAFAYITKEAVHEELLPAVNAALGQKKSGTDPQQQAD
jgi:hypothetical protein